VLCRGAIAQAPASAPTTQPGIAHFPGISVDVKTKQIRVDCQALNVDIRLEFFCVLNGTNEHESILRTAAKPSDIHTALLMLGLTPGSPIRYSEAAQKWIPPHGPPLHISCEYVKNGKTVRVPAYRMMRDANTKKVPNAFTWIFAGSRVMDDGKYAADVTGYVVSLVNFDLTLIDVPELASNANETLEWEYNPDTVPKTGTPVTMIIEPAGNDAAAPATASANATASNEPEPAVLKLLGSGSMTLNDQPVKIDDLAAAIKKLPEGTVIRVAQNKVEDPARLVAVFQAIEASGHKMALVSSAGSAAAPSTQPNADAPISNVHINQKEMSDLKARWEKAVRPNAAALREAAQAHYEVISAMRKEQQRLINEADRIQRAIDELDKDYQDMTTPSPEP
jgi:biopolymer transport protein ExbD